MDLCQSVAILVQAQVGIQAPGLEFPLHLPSRQLHQDSLSQVFVCCVHRMAPVACRPIIKCGKSGFFPGLVHSLCCNMDTSCHEASCMSDLWEDLPASERHSVRLLTRQK